MAEDDVAVVDSEPTPAPDPGAKLTPRQYAPSTAKPAPLVANPTEESMEAHWYPRLLQEAERRYPDDPSGKETFINSGIREGQTQSKIYIQMRNQQINAQKGAVDKMLMTPLKDTGIGPRSMEEANRYYPGFEDLVSRYGAMDPKLFKHVQDTMDHNIRQDNVETPERTQNYRILKGMSVSRAEDFVGEHLTEYNLSSKRLTELTILQAKLRAKQEDTTHLESAMHRLAPILNPVGAFQSHTDKAAQRRYDLVLGHLSELFDELKKDGKPIPRDFEGLQKLMAPVIQSIPGEHWYSFATRAFEPSSGERSLITDKLRTELKRAPTEVEIGREHQLRNTLIEGFKKRYEGRAPTEEEIQTMRERVRGQK